MPGIEHPQLDWIKAAFAGRPAAPATGLISPLRATPNQRSLSVAIGLAWCRIGRLDNPSANLYRARAAALFSLMADAGHQAVGPSYGSEAGCPDPHSTLWMGAMATILREAKLQGLAELYAAAVGYWADHMALCRAFWTPQGARVTGSRAKGAPGKPLRPSWAQDSAAAALILDLPDGDLLKPQDAQVLAILKDCSGAFPAIRALSETTRVKLAVPVRKWELPGGGFLAALAKEVPLNDPLAWIAVDAAGEITGAGQTLASCEQPTGEPTLIFGMGSGAPAKVPEPPAVPPSSAVPSDFAARLSALSLSKRDSRTRDVILGQLAAGPTPEGLARIADTIAGFGIGEHQAQAPSWRALVADLRKAAG